MVFVFIEILFKILLFKGGVLIYAEHCMYMLGGSSPNRVPAPHSWSVTSHLPRILESEWGFGLKASSRRWLCRPSFSLDSLQLERPDAYAPGLLRAGLLWGRVVYTATHGARLSSVPSGDWSANPATDGASGHSSLQRMILSVSSTRKAAELRGSPPLGGL